MVDSLREFQYQVAKREAPKRPELLGTPDIYNPVWTLFGQHTDTKVWAPQDLWTGKSNVKADIISYLNHHLYCWAPNPVLMSFSLFYHVPSTCLPLSDIVMIRDKEQKKDSWNLHCSLLANFSWCERSLWKQTKLKHPQSWRGGYGRMLSWDLQSRKAAAVKTWIMYILAMCGASHCTHAWFRSTQRQSFQWAGF